MNSAVLALLDNSGFVINGKPNISKIKDTPKSKLLRFCEELGEMTSYSNYSPETSTYTHSASLALSGSIYPCAGASCRLEMSEQLAQFAALYSNHVYLNNFMHRHVLHPDFDREFKKDIIDDIKVLSYLYPLIESNLISLVTYEHLCPHCLGDFGLNENIVGEFKSACEYVHNLFLTDVKYYLERNYHQIFLELEGPETLVPHKTSSFEIKNTDENYTKFCELLANNKSDKVLLSSDQVKFLNLHEIESADILRSLAVELVGANFLKTSFLSENDLEINMLKTLSGNPINVYRSSLMEKYLTCIVPFLHNINPVDIIKLRNNELDSFILFRQSFTKAIEEYKFSGDKFTEYDAKTLYDDMVQPAMSKLDLKFNQAKRGFSKDANREIISWTAALSAGFYTGVFSSSVLAGLAGSAALAGAKLSVDFVKKILAKGDAEDAIKEEPMYFLWKIKQMSK